MPKGVTNNERAKRVKKHADPPHHKTRRPSLFFPSSHYGPGWVRPSQAPPDKEARRDQKLAAAGGLDREQGGGPIVELGEQTWGRTDRREVLDVGKRKKEDGGVAATTCGVGGR